MGMADTVLELGLIGLLSFTLVHCVRLQRALGNLRQDRQALHEAITGFDTGTRQAEAGLLRLRAVADELGGQIGKAAALREDLAFLSERGEGLADRLDGLVRAGKGAALPVTEDAPQRPATTPDSGGKLRSAAERNLMAVLQGRR